jgi:hypothetical protein
MVLDVADAASICREGTVPTSKIYRAMEKLAQLQLAQVQPKMYAALPVDAIVDRVVALVRERADRLTDSSEELRQALLSLTGKVRGSHPFVDLVLGAESHVRRHLVHLADANNRILSYMEARDLASIDQTIGGGFPILRCIARNAAERKIRQVVFGFSYRTAPQLLESLKTLRIFAVLPAYGIRVRSAIRFMSWTSASSFCRSITRSFRGPVRLTADPLQGTGPQPR